MRGRRARTMRTVSRETRSRASGGAGPLRSRPAGSDGILLATKATLLAFSGLTMLAFVALFVMAAKTEQYFAWTINPAATAAFLGAAYGAGCVLVILGVRSGHWTRVRTPYLTILIFTVITLVATLRHLDRFHFGSDAVIARLAAWFWLAVYLLVPVAMMATLIMQERSRQLDPLRRQPLPPQLAVPLAVQGAILSVVGVALFVAPDSARLIWPWALTPLTARMVAAWLVAFGVASVLILRQANLAEARISAWAYAVLGALELVVAFRYAGTVRWSSPAAWLYVALAISIVGLAAWALVRRDGGPAAARHA